MNLPPGNAPSLTGCLDLSDYTRRFLDLAKSIGLQEDGVGGHMELFRLKRAIPGHPIDSTVSRQTIDAYLQSEAQP